MSSDTRTWDTGVWEEQQKELRALSPVRQLMRRLNLEALVYESAPFPVLLCKLSALIPACLLWWVIYEPHRLASSTSLPEGTHAITLLPGAWGDPATGAYGGLPELPGILLRLGTVHRGNGGCRSPLRRQGEGPELHDSSRCAFTIDCAHANSRYFRCLCAGRLDRVHDDSADPHV